LGANARLYRLLLLIISFPTHWDMWGNRGRASDCQVAMSPIAYFWK
jgi:hypothetical protein